MRNWNRSNYVLKMISICWSRNVSFNFKILYIVEWGLRTVCFLVEKETNDHSKLMDDVSKMSALAEQTETDLSRANTEGQLIENNLRTLRKRLEKQSTQKIDIEEKILELLQDQITTDSASNIRGKLLREKQGQRRNAELNMYTTEYQLSQVLLELEKWKGQLTKSRENADRLNVSFLIDVHCSEKYKRLSLV